MSLNNRKLSISLFVIGILILVLSVSGIQAQDEMVLRVGLAEPINLDPASGSNDPEVLLNRHIYDYLIELLPDGSLAASLAESWDISDDGLSYTLNLVQNATFHDGKAFTAEDVVFSFNRLVAVGSSVVGVLGQKQVGTDDAGNAIMEPTWAVEATDDYTVVFTLEAANADFVYGLSHRFAAILPAGLEMPNILGEDGSLANFNGTGPFRLESFNAGEGATLVANDNYWGGRPTLDRVELIFIDDSTAQVNALQNGELDLIFKIPNDLLPSLQSNEDITVTTIASNVHPVIRIRSDVGHLGEDVRVRQAFKHATDRELLNIDTLNGLGIVANNDPIGPVYGPLYNPQEGLAYDPQLSCDLLAEYVAENPDNEWVSLDGDSPRLEVDFHVSDAFEYALLAEFMQQQWEEACIFVTLSIEPANIYYADGGWLDVELGLTGWGTRATPQEYLNIAYTTDAIWNESRWSNARLDELAAQASQTTDLEERSNIYNEISQIFEEEGPVIIPFFRPVSSAYRNTVQGLVLHSFPGRTDFDSVAVGN
jgi:peptide/nickel transport system substrate-binding protein